MPNPDEPADAPTGATGATGDSPVADVADVVEDLVRVVKPRLRGWLHAGAFPVSVVAGLVLVVLADDVRETVATAVYATSAALLFGVSALYHRGRWSPRTERALKRLDHSNIFLIIAGTYTPFSVILLGNRGGTTLLWIVWGAALAGIAFRVLWVGAPRLLYTPVYVGLGWVAVFYLGAILDTGGAAVAILLAVGGLTYTAGGAVYALKRPDPAPRWFGFHEVFHACTLLAYGVHYAAVSMVTYAQSGA